MITSQSFYLSALSLNKEIKASEGGTDQSQPAGFKQTDLGPLFCFQLVA